MNPERTTTARHTYQSVRNELVQRIEHRDKLIVAYLAATAAIFGLALSKSASTEILLVIPYLTLGASLLLSLHHNVIGSIREFLEVELYPFLKDIGAGAPQWEDSKTARRQLSVGILQRAVGHVFLMIPPAVASLVMNATHMAWAFPYGALWWSGAVFTLVSFWSIVHSHIERKSVQRRIEQERKP